MPAFISNHLVSTRKPLPGKFKHTREGDTVETASDRPSQERVFQTLSQLQRTQSFLRHFKL